MSFNSKTIMYSTGRLNNIYIYIYIYIYICLYVESWCFIISLMTGYILMADGTARFFSFQKSINFPLVYLKALKRNIYLFAGTSL